MDRVTTQPLIECQWGQGAPYNNNLKMGKKNRVQLTGCTALAIAQIAYYWMVQKGYLRGCKATSKYTTKTNGLSVEALEPLMVFDWKNLKAKPKTADEKAAVAQLCEYISKALRSDFGRYNTSASRLTAETVINYYLRLGNSTHYYETSSPKTKTQLNKKDFEQAIYDDITKGRPVLLTATSSSSDGKDATHAFIVDGYDAEADKYHINWGWSGDDDGWYALNALTPDGYNYSKSRMAVVNIEPLYKLGDVNGDGIINVSDVLTILNTAQQGRSTKAADINSDGKVTQKDADILNNYLVTGEWEDVSETE